MINHLLQFVFFLWLVQCTAFASRLLLEPVKNAPSDDQLVVYHKGALLSGNISVNLIWYGSFKSSQRAIVHDFIASLTYAAPSIRGEPSVASWWNTIAHYYAISGRKTATTSPALSIFPGKQLTDEAYSIGKSLTNLLVIELASRGGRQDAINVLLTSPDVAVEGFCSSRCGSHGSKRVRPNRSPPRFAYIWVGNSETQCPGHCAWPFHRPIYGPQTDPLIAPNGDVGMEGVVMNLASLLAGTVTNPFGNGFFQGPSKSPLEAASACPGVFGSGAFPGYTGKILVDSKTGGSYNANGVHGRKYLLPALYDPLTASCSTLV